MRWEVYLEQNLSTIIWKESLNSDDHLFHQYQQNKQSPFILTELTEYKKTMTYDVRIPGPSLGLDKKNVAGLNK